jgi:hypothetical protein
LTDDPREPPVEDGGPETSAWASLGQAWRQEPEPHAPIDVAAIRRRASRFAWRIRVRNGLEWAACGVLILRGATWTVHGELVAGVLFIAVSLWIAAVIWKRGRNAPQIPASATTEEHLAYERAQLQRQHALLSRVRLWYLAPIAVVVVVLDALAVVGRLRAGGEVRAANYGVVAVIVALQLALFALIDFANRRAAAKLAERLTAFGKEEPREGHTP